MKFTLKCGAFCVLILGCSLPLQARIIKAPRDVPVFNPQDPGSPGGIFLQGSDLEIRGTPTAEGLILVVYHPSGASPSPGYCRMADLNLSETDFPAAPKIPIAGKNRASVAQPVAPSKAYTESLEEGLALAAQANKLLFIKFGRSSCGHCMALGELMKKGEVKPGSLDFIIADIDCDDPAESQLFNKKFKVQGRTLPFVVIADPKGKQLVARSGGGKAGDFNDMMEAAKIAVRN